MSDSFFSQTARKGNIVHLPGTGPARRLRDQDLAGFLDYWMAMRKGADVPRRADIDPRGMSPLLSEAFIAERIAPGLARLRIAGMHLSDLMGMEVRGMPLSALIEPQDRDRLAELLVDLFDGPARLEIGLTSVGSFGRPPLTGRLVILPLRSDLGDISRAVGCLVSDGPAGRTPRRFTITSSEVVRIGATSDAAAAPLTLDAYRADQPLDPVVPARVRGNGDRSHLRLIETD
ncbi:PAS domain-containing protein [Roseovarius halotolerans]|uniref:PAS domain protein n=1 Tax=Roseovarius halotolerans TaxID=505353 RepID=A0A1X6YN00_9RHOB|nr:PAS domain-containing protein [Roseovarius halotolerans]RKT34244.1 PAS domain-containing protein [Roseovarius halotolerans]SLN25629.1 PAS domain protein [Roseovarius halotolerans]